MPGLYPAFADRPLLHLKGLLKGLGLGFRAVFLTERDAMGPLWGLLFSIRGNFYVETPKL